MKLFRSVVLSTIFISPVFSATTWIGLNVTLDTNTCIAPKAYETCYANAVAATVYCNTHTVTVLGKEACACADAALQIQCFAEACWNKVYSCEYQSLVYNYFQCEVAVPPVPYWPAPDNAPGGCSCNAGLILSNAIVAISNTIPCNQNAANLAITNPFQSSVMSGSCICCMESVVISSFFDICPNSDPNVLGLPAFESALAGTYPWSQCGSSLAAYNCVNDLKFIAPTQFATTGALYSPANMPTSTGTIRPSNVAGQVSAPPSGSSFLWSAIGTQFTILAAAPEKNIVAVSSASKVGSGSGSAATAASSPSSGSAAKLGASGVLQVNCCLFLLSLALFSFL